LQHVLPDSIITNLGSIVFGGFFLNAAAENGGDIFGEAFSDLLFSVKLHLRLF
jgi:hypothetical protein